MKTLRLQHGDLVPGPGGLETVTGPDMLIQDLRGALGEPLGNDRFHPGWGSVIDDYVGLPLDEGTAFEIEQEVNRVIGNYMAVQDEYLRRDQTSGRAPRYTTDDVIAAVSGVDVKYRHDHASITIGIQTMSRSEAAVQLEIGGGNV